MYFAGGAGAVSELEANYCAEAIRIGGRANQTCPQARLGVNISKELRRRAVLGYDQIDPTILVEIGDGAAALLTVHLYARTLSRYGREPPGSVPAQAQTASGVLSPCISPKGEKVLADENVF